MAKKSPDPEDRPRPKPPSKKRSKDDPPPVRLRPGEEEEDEDEYDYRPKAQKGAGMAEFDTRGRKVDQRRKRLWQNITTFTTLAAILGAFGFGIYMIIWAKQPPPPDPDMMAFVPAKTTYIFGVNMREARYNEKFRTKIDGSIDRAVPSYMQAVMKQLKLRTCDLDRVIIASDAPVSAVGLGTPRGNVEAMGMTGVTAILKLRTTTAQTKDERDRNEPTVEIQFSRAELQQATSSEERSHNGKRYYAGQSFDGTRFFYHGASAHVLVITESERNMKELLDKSDTVIVVGGPIKEFADQLGGENFWYGMVFSGIGGGDYERLTDPLGFGGKMLRADAGGEVGFAFAGGVYNTGVDFTNITYFADPLQAKRLQEAAEEVYKGMKELIDSLGKIPAESIGLEARFKLDELVSANFKASGNLFIYTTRYRTSVWEELLETGVKVGNRSIRPTLPFYKGPFAGLGGNVQFGMAAPPPGEGGMNAIWGPGGGIAIGP